MKRVRLNKLIIAPPFGVCPATAQHESYIFSNYPHSFLATHISKSIAGKINDADVIDIEIFTTIQLPK
ncbi:MAG TPA: hypothetical protein VIV35_05595 [Chitinophagaceae bacterium]